MHAAKLVLILLALTQAMLAPGFTQSTPPQEAPSASSPGALPTPATAAAPATGSPATAAALPVAQPIAYDTEPLPHDPAAALLLASKANGLGNGEISPWYMKAHYQAYDARGKPSSKGVLELYWAARDRYRVSYTSDTFTQSTFHSAGEVSWVGSEGVVPYAESIGLDELVHPIVILPNTPKPQLREDKRSKVPLTCLEFQREDSPFLTSYCLEPLRLTLRTRQNDGVRVVYNRIALFQHRFVALQIAVSDGAEQVLDLEVETLRLIEPGDLQALIPPPDAFSPTKKKVEPETLDAGVQAVPAVQASARVLAGHIIFKAPATFPEEARRRRVQGVVRLEVKIGRDGLVHDPVVVHDPDAALSQAAVEAVSRRRYVPYMLNGVPIEVRTNIAVHFSLER